MCHMEYKQSWGVLSFFEAPLNSEVTVDAILILKNKLRCEVFH